MSEKFRATVPPSTALKVLKLRRQGMAVTEVARATGLPPARVEEVSEKLGWPDEAKVDREIRELEELVVLDSGMQTQGAPKPGPARPRPVDEPERTAPAATPSSSPSSAPLEAMISRGLKSPSKKIVSAAERAEKAVATLRELLAVDEEKRKADAERAQKLARYESEVARLERELAEAKKRRQALKSPSSSAKPKGKGSTSGSSGRVSPCTAAGVLPADVRAWASMAGVEISPRGAISESVVNRYLAAMGGAA